MIYKTPDAKRRHDLHVLVIGRMKRAGWQPDYKPALEYAKRTFLHTQFGYQTSKDMGDEELALACDTLRSNSFVFHTPPMPMFEAPSEKMIRQLQALGYSIEKFYPKGFLGRFLARLLEPFWDKLLDGSPMYYDGFRLDPHKDGKGYCNNVYLLIRPEADYCIKRLFKIEERLHLGGYPRTGRMADSEMERVLRMTKVL